MPGAREVEGGPINLLMEGLRAAQEEHGATLSEADSLEKKALERRGEAPRVYDSQIHRATSELFTLASTQPPRLSNRELLEGVLVINQHKPSRTMWSGPADIEGTLARFDALTEGAPALIRNNPYDQIIGGVITSRAVRVNLSKAQGMGGLPEANITFGYRRVIQNGEDMPLLPDVEKVITKPHQIFAEDAIGAVAIQSLIDKQIFEAVPFACGRDHGEHSNGSKIESLARVVAQLVEVTRIDLDTTHLDKVVQQIQGHRAENERMAEIRRKLRRRQHRLM